MSHTDNESSSESEGGLTAQSVTESQLSRSARYQRFSEQWIIAPFRVLWSDWRARIGSIIVLFYLFIGTVGTVLVEPTYANQAPSLIQPFQNMAYPLGTGELGLDLFARAVHSTPAMLIMIASGGLATTILGTAVGTVSGYRGGLIDSILTLISDIVLNIPGLPLLVVLSAILEPREPWAVGLLLSVNAWAGLSRSVRAEVLTLRDVGYVESSRLMGVSNSNIILRDILPNIMPFVLINFVAAARNIIFASVGLYFLGILPFSNQNWGVMLNAAYEAGALVTSEMTHWLLVPMFAIIFLSTGLILLSQGLDRVFNPRVRARHSKTSGGEEEHA